MKRQRLKLTQLYAHSAYLDPFCDKTVGIIYLNEVVNGSLVSTYFIST